MTYEAVIGLEVHAQLLTRTKAFCSCSTEFGAPINTQVCPTCLGLPGALPVLNRDAVALAVRAALALGLELRKTSRFARKNYFYPDLPKGFQISQFDEPFSEKGILEIEVTNEAGEKSRRPIRITRIHMEEDAGKSQHGHGGDSVIDLNRSGVALIEIVGEPDLRSAKEAATYLRELRDILVFLGVNDGNLEEGSFRCDANVSIRPKGQEAYGTRAELKNINSFRFVEKAIDYEIQRQEAVLSSGGRVVQETRGWNETEEKTFSMRSKETAQDYRYFPEPDLPLLILEDAFIEKVRSETPELPRAMRARFVKDHGITEYAASVLTQHPKVAELFEAAAKGCDGVRAANFIQAEVLRDVTTHGLSASIPVSSDQLVDLLGLVAKEAISGKQAKEVYAKMKGTSDKPSDVVKALGMEQVSDAGAIEEIAKKVLAANPKQAESLKSGKLGLLGFFVGAMMKESKGSANPQLASDTIKRLLGLS